MDKRRHPDHSAPSDLESKKWADMTGLERLRFLGRLLVALCTFGFVYPNILSDDSTTHKTHAS